MRANELMIGDYVDVYGETQPDESGFYRTCRISAIDTKQWEEVGVNGGDAIIPIGPDDPDSEFVSPIDITEEFLQKNFQPRYKDIYELTTLWGIRPFHDHWQVCLLTMDEFGGGSWEGAFEVRYVHEVQQFLRLLKVGKEVVI